MIIIESSATYQGYPVEALSFVRRPGLYPDFGYVDIDIENFKRLEIKGIAEVPWRGPNGGMATIDAWDSIRARRTLTLGGQSPVPGIGLFPVGDLVMSDFDFGDDGGIAHDPTRWRDIYISPGGIEEITNDLDAAKNHDTGVWRIPIMDVRFFWKYGVLSQSINRRLDGGKYDPSSIRADEKPWSATDVISFLFSQLPGSPIVLFSDEVKSLELDTPDDIIGQMTPVRDVLARLLSRNRLQASLLQNNAVSIYSASILSRIQGKFFSSRGLQAASDLKTGDVYERKSVTIVDRPPAVTVVGQKRNRAVVLNYVPIYQDQDDRFYRLDSIPKRWGYKLEDIRRAALIGPEKAFKDVPDKVIERIFAPAERGKFKRGEGRAFAERMRILQKWAFKGYGPAIAFRDVGDRGLTQKELQAMPFLPAREWGEKTGPGIDDFRIRPPQVRAFTIRQDFFDGIGRYTGNFPNIKAFEEMSKAVDAHLKSMTDARRELELNFARLSAVVTQKVKSLDSFNAWVQRRGAVNPNIRVGPPIPFGQLSIEEQAGLLATGQIVKIGLDSVFVESDKFFGPTDVFIRKENVAKFNRAYNELRKLLSSHLAEERKIEEARAAEEGIRKNLEKAFRELGGMKGWLNQPYGELKDGEYSFDATTGIILSGEVLGIMEEPFAVSLEQTTLIDHGHVAVQFGHELNSNSAFDWSQFTFMDDGSGSPVLVAGCSPAVIPSQMEHDPNLRVYENVVGQPVNGVRCIDQAASRAWAVTEPKSVTGFVYELGGFVDVEAISADVQYTFDGDMATTFVGVNVPNSPSMPRGPSRIKVETPPLQLSIHEVAKEVLGIK